MTAVVAEAGVEGNSGPPHCQPLYLHTRPLVADPGRPSMQHASEERNRESERKRHTQHHLAHDLENNTVL